VIQMTSQKDISKETLDGWTKKQEKKQDNISEILSREALRLKSKRRYNEALTLINLSIEHDELNSEYYNLKGLILQDLHKFRQSIEAFDKSLEIQESEEVMLNKVNAQYGWANSLNDKNQALELITEAIENAAYLTMDIDMEKFWYLKGSILDCLGDKIASRKCYMIAENMTDEISQLDKHTDYINTTDDSLICITGTQFYQGLEPFSEGLVVDLVRDSENEHDPDAVRVEVGGMALGYVANSPHTMIEGVKSASEIKNTKFQKAEVKFLYLYEYVIAKLI
jgi:tetratricopeptide (TPR) repeat protein